MELHTFLMTIIAFSATISILGVIFNWLLNPVKENQIDLKNELKDLKEDQHNLRIELKDLKEDQHNLKIELKADIKQTNQRINSLEGKMDKIFNLLQKKH